ncbi:hypothetical protein GYMLUDRAFT_46694 [Collybiopsis luxurians FD-317 M1]|uniref:Uncharacterized protein n=1 Tax=Collybiopsis luxurians FD-317 M1 TaxID=944289 RepID=A0A0D0B1R8_9AGAR|nr:hypothetical protein GYMLUDRAFT_46694 [Collybiopsis luxurians FD-317 M1]
MSPISSPITNFSLSPSSLFRSDFFALFAGSKNFETGSSSISCYRSSHGMKQVVNVHNDVPVTWFLVINSVSGDGDGGSNSIVLDDHCWSDNLRQWWGDQ